MILNFGVIFLETISCILYFLESVRFFKSKKKKLCRNLFSFPRDVIASFSNTSNVPLFDKISYSFEDDKISKILFKGLQFKLVFIEAF